MSFNSKWRTLGAGVLGAALLVSTGCAETALVGQLDDSELQDPQVLPLAALGMSREINDMVFGRYIDLFAVGGHTDQITFAGVAGAEQRTAIGDVRGREESGFFEQIHEAVWAAYKIVDLAYSLQGDSPEFNTSPVVARAWLNAGFMERVMADNFCESIYQYGPGGGFNLAALEEWAADNGLVEGNEGDVLISKDSMYARAAYSFERAIEWADAAIAAGNTEVPEDAEYFDPEQVRIAAYGGLAQARHALASYGVNPGANWAAATAAAANVPTGFVELWNTDEDLRFNQSWQLTWANDDVSFWAGEVDGVQWGSAFARHVEPGDTRGGVVPCQEYGVTTGGEDVVFTSSNVLQLNNGDCAPDPAWSNWPITDRLEASEMPRVLLEAIEDPFTEVPAVQGSDARLIEAEAALFAGAPNFGLFTSKINEVRSFYGASPITAPTTLGELEYPNAVDDAFSILDREWLLDDLDQGNRRYFHLDRWNHPFIADNNTTMPRWRDLLAEQGAGFQRGSCFPLPQRECNQNPAIECEVLGQS